MDFHGYTQISPTGFYHTSRKPVPQLEHRVQHAHPAFKPRGLWYDVGGAWIEWMESEMPEWYASSRFLYSVVVSPAARILRITSGRELEDFMATYGSLHPTTGRFPVPNWVAIADEWDGIEFSPYMYELRCDYIWYSMVDVSSGCVWNPGVVSLELVAEH